MPVPGRPRALVMDDDEDLRELLALRLEEMDFDVVTASGGREALAHCSEGRFALVITDLLMPGGDGLSFIEDFRRIDAGAPVFIMTGYEALGASEEALEKGASGCLPKPFQASDLERCVRRARDGGAAGIPPADHHSTRASCGPR